MGRIQRPLTVRSLAARHPSCDQNHTTLGRRRAILLFSVAIECAYGRMIMIPIREAILIVLTFAMFSMAAAVITFALVRP